MEQRNIPTQRWTREELRNLVDATWQLATEGQGGWPSFTITDKLIDETRRQRREWWRIWKWRPA